MNASASRISTLTKDLWVHWQRTREDWSDEKSLEFEHKYLQELMTSIDHTMIAIEDLDKLVNKIRHDCE